MEARIESRRTRARPRKNSMDNIIAAGQKRGKSLAEMNRLVPERKEWKRMTERTRSLRGRTGKEKKKKRVDSRPINT